MTPNHDARKFAKHRSTVVSCVALCTVLMACNGVGQTRDARPALEPKPGSNHDGATGGGPQLQQLQGDGRLVIFDDALNSEFNDQSWCDHDLAETGVVHSGHAAIMMDPSSWTGLNFTATKNINAATYGSLDFWIRGAEPGGQLLLASLLKTHGASSKTLKVERFIDSGSVPTDGWAHVQIPFSAFKMTSGPITALVLQAGSGDTQSPLYLDDIALMPPSADGGSGAATSGSTTGGSATTTGGATTGTTSGSTTGTSSGSTTGATSGATTAKDVGAERG